MSVDANSEKKEYVVSVASSSAAENKIPLQTSENVIKVNVDDNLPIENNVLKVIGRSFYAGILEMVKSVLVILVFLAFFGISGLFEWWISFVDKLY